MRRFVFFMFAIVLLFAAGFALADSTVVAPATDTLITSPAPETAPGIWSQILGWLGITGWGGIITLFFGLLAAWLGIDKVKTIRALDAVGELFKDLSTLLAGTGSTTEVAQDVRQIGALVKTIRTNDTQVAAVRAKIVSAEINKGRRT